MKRLSKKSTKRKRKRKRKRRRKRRRKRKIIFYNLRVIRLHHLKAIFKCRDKINNRYSIKFY